MDLLVNYLARRALIYKLLRSAPVILLGVFYLASSLTKLFSIHAFATTLAQYAYPGLFILAPVIIGAELVLGLLLLVGYRLRLLGFLSLILLLGFTLVFTYGYLALGLKDCGCFGDVIKTSPEVSILRNVVLMVLSLSIWRNYPTPSVSSYRKPAWFSALAVGALILVISGFTLDKDRISFPPMAGTPIAYSAARFFVPTHSQRSYLVFVFSPTCAHCWDMTENVKRFKEVGLVDSIIALYPKTIPRKDVERYLNNFEPNFRVVPVANDTLAKLTRALPLTLYIQHDTVKAVMKGEVRSPFTYQQLHTHE
jgi:uncharacterized membrane protein YphA (DoxX/SURF4 family)